MADKDKKKEQKRVNRRSMGSMYMQGEFHRLVFSIFRGIRNVLGIILCILLLWFLLSGSINQVKTGESLAQYATRWGKYISIELESIRDGNGFVKITKDGVYLKGKTPPNKSAVDIDKLPSIPDTEIINKNSSKEANKDEKESKDKGDSNEE